MAERFEAVRFRSGGSAYSGEPVPEDDRVDDSDSHTAAQRTLEPVLRRL